MQDQYVSVDEAAEELDVSRATAWKWIKRHELQTYRFMGERKTFVRRDDLARLQEPIPVDFEKKASGRIPGRLLRRLTPAATGEGTSILQRVTTA